MFRQRFVGMEGNGAGDRIRTGDIDLGKVALYQLSYSRKSAQQLILSRRVPPNVKFLYLPRNLRAALLPSNRTVIEMFYYECSTLIIFTNY